MLKIIESHQLTISYLALTLHFAQIWIFILGIYYFRGSQPANLTSVIVFIPFIILVIWYYGVFLRTSHSYINSLSLASGSANFLYKLTEYLDTMDVLHAVGVVTLTTLISLIATFQNYVAVERWEPLIYGICFAVHGQLTWGCLLGSLGLWIYLGIGVRRGIGRGLIQRTIVHWMGPFGYMFDFV